MRKAFVFLYLALCVTGTASVFGMQEDEKELPHDPRAVELVIQGAVYDLKGEYSKALNAYNEALIYDPDSPSICHAIAKDYLMLGKIETAVQMLQRGIRIDPQYLDNRQLLAAVHHRQGNLELAKQEYLEILKVNPKHVDAHLNLGAIYAAENNVEQAAQHYEKLIDWGVASREVHFELGNLYYENEYFDKAHRVFKNYVRDNPEDERGYLAVGTVLMAQDTTRAIEWYQNTYRENHEFGKVLDELTNILIAAEQWQQAIDLYKDQVENDTTDIFNQLRLGEIYLAKGDSAQAIDIFTGVTQSHPEEWRAFYSLGQIYFLRQAFDKSIPYYKKIVKIEEELPSGVRAEAWWRLGVAHQQGNDLDAAEESYREAQSLQPNHPFTNFQLGQLLFQKNKYQEALKYLNTAVEQDPDNAVYLGTLAAVYDELGEFEKSETLYEKALEIDPENATILNNFSYSLTERDKRLDEALQMVRKALEVDPENGAFLDTLGWVYYKMGEYEKALTYIKKSIEQRDTSAEVLEHLGDVYEKMGNMELAIEAWRKARELDPDRESVVLKLKKN